MGWACLTKTQFSVERDIPTSMARAKDRAAANTPVVRGSVHPRDDAVSETQKWRLTARLRDYVVDGSTFIDDDYLIKGVAGGLLWKGRFELRVDAEMLLERVGSG